MNKAQKIITLVSLLAVAAIGIWAMGQPSRWQTIAAYRSSLDGRTKSQVHNLELAVRSINGKVLPPGAEFSFNRTVGSWNPERGYVKAPVSYDGELIPAWGGGVCQASSTLYNAALLAGMDILERHRHMFPAKYVPPGQDAAVAQYDIDLRFRNPYNFPVRVDAETVGNLVICKIVAQQQLNKEISVEREIKQVTEPSEVIRARATGSDIHWRVRNRGQVGLQVAVYRRVTVGARSTRSLISEDTYPPMNRLLEGS
jgi:vancomycin resistance protein VanW